jgi:hypothetical protein
VGSDAGHWFSSVAFHIARAPVLEDPEEFADWIRKTVVPQGGRSLHVEVLKGTYDFVTWMTPLNLQITGIASTHWEPDANHVWRIISRSSLANLGYQDSSVQCLHQDWLALEADDEDAILMCKQFMHSASLSQMPILILPSSIAKKLNIGDLKVNNFNPLGPGTLTQFRKTAVAVSKEPWKLFKARQYLESLCDRNTLALPSEPPTLHFLAGYQRPSLDVSTMLFDGHLGAAETQPRAIIVRAPTAGEKRKRLARCPAVPSAVAIAGIDAVDEGGGPVGDNADDGDDAPPEVVPAAAAVVVLRRPAAVVLRRPAAASAAAAPPPPGQPPPPPPETVAAAAADAPVCEPMYYGCAKCRNIRTGCVRCKAWATSRYQRYYFIGELVARAPASVAD